MNLLRNIVLLAICCVGTAYSGLAVWQPKILLRADYGDAENEFGRKNIEKSPGAPLVVTCFTVTDNHILIFDKLKNDIKVYSISGEYEKTIPVAKKENGFMVAFPVEDIVSDDDSIYLLCNYAGQPLDKSIPWTRYQVINLDFQTGEHKNRTMINVPDLGTHLVKRPDGKEYRGRIEGTVSLVHMPNGIGVYDSRVQNTYKVFDELRPIAKSQQNYPIEGRTIGKGSIVKTDKTGTIKVRGGDGSELVLRQRGTMAAVSKNGDYFAITHPSDEDIGTIQVTIFNENGNPIGRVTMPKPINPGNFLPLYSHSYYKITVRDIVQLYSLSVTGDGVLITRWEENEGGSYE